LLKNSTNAQKQRYLKVLYWVDERGSRYLTAEELVVRYRDRFGELPE
jgi:hypothetical protein